jgi:hypothetical protein
MAPSYDDTYVPSGSVDGGRISLRTLTYDGHGNSKTGLAQLTVLHFGGGHDSDRAKIRVLKDQTRNMLYLCCPHFKAICMYQGHRDDQSFRLVCGSPFLWFACGWSA